MNNKEYIAELAQQTGYSQEDTQKLGCFYQVEITASEEFDLYGKVVK